MLYLIIFIAVALFIFMSSAFLIAYVKEDNSVADIAWGLGFVVVAWISFISAGHFQPAGLAATLLVTLWGLRLSTHIYLRNRGKKEDPRYTQLRAHWGARQALNTFFKVFMLQGLLLLMISFEVIVINSQVYAPVTLLVILGVIIWIVGFLCEAIGDYQLYTFMKNPAHHGQLMTHGLWRFTRHPNYFGEITLWWGMYIIACTAPFGLVAIISPLTITTLLLFVSGIPLTEKLMAQNPAFAQYKARTSMLIPWWPKKRD